MWAKQLDVGHHVQAASIEFDLRDHFSKFQVDHKNLAKQVQVQLTARSFTN